MNSVPPDTPGSGGTAALENLVNQVAHDVRNFAFTIGLQAEMGARRASASPDLKAHFEAVLRQVDGLKRYLEQMLLYGRRPALSTSAFDAVSFVREQVQRYQFERKPDAPPLSISVTDGLPCRVLWDTRAIGSAFIHVLDNAVRSTDPPKPVTVGVRAEGPMVVIEVTDRGAGIPAETLSKLAVPMAVRRAGGAGLGLAIARKMAEAHGGSLAIESSASGTTVRFTIPSEVVPG